MILGVSVLETGGHRLMTRTGPSPPGGAAAAGAGVRAGPAGGISTATAWRYVTETVALLAARSPKLRRALRDAAKAGHAC